MKTSSWKDVLALAWPLIIANSFWNLQLTIDRVFLGQYSTEGLGAAMAVMGVFWVPMALLQQTAGYVTTFVAQYSGAKENEKVGASLWQALVVSMVGGMSFLFLRFLSGPFFQWVGHPPTVAGLEVEYFNALSWSAMPTALVAATSGFFTGIGKTRTVIGINFVGLFLNALLDPIMIFGRFGCPEFGVAGAGYATAIATFGAALFGLYLNFRPEYEQLYKIRSSRSINTALLKQFLKFGLPSGMQWAFEGLAFTVFLILLGRTTFGEAALASSSIAVTVMMLSVLPSMGVAQAVMTIVGQRIGEKNIEDATRATWHGVRISMCYMAMVALSFVLVPQFYVSWFKNEENAALWSTVSVMTPTLLKIVAVFTVLDSIYLNLSFALKGAGDTRYVSLLSLIIPWPFMVLPTYLFVSVWPSTFTSPVIAAWWFAALYSAVITSTLFLRFRGGTWKSMSVMG